MLASHRDQENLVRAHQPKTPGARFAKTPGKLDQNEENAVTVFVKKDILGGKLGGGKDGNIVTPIGKREQRSQ